MLVTEQGSRATAIIECVREETFYWVKTNSKYLMYLLRMTLCLVNCLVTAVPCKYAEIGQSSDLKDITIVELVILFT